MILSLASTKSKPEHVHCIRDVCYNDIEHASTYILRVLSTLQVEKTCARRCLIRESCHAHIPWKCGIVHLEFHSLDQTGSRQILRYVLKQLKHDNRRKQCGVTITEFLIKTRFISQHKILAVQVVLLSLIMLFKVFYKTQTCHPPQCRRVLTKYLLLVYWTIILKQQNAHSSVCPGADPLLTSQITFRSFHNPHHL